MKAFISACVALVVISAGANFALNQMGFSASDRTVSDAVRLD